MAKLPKSDVSEHLATLHSGISRAYEAHGPMTLGKAPKIDQRFARIVRAISGQQLSVKAAATIFGRVQDLLVDVTAESVLRVDPTDLRACGLSGAKVASLTDLAERVDAGVLRLESLGRIPVEDAVAHLVAVRGIGIWTAQMFLIDSLQRPDVWPTGDLGVRKGFAKLMDLAEVPTAKELEPMGDPYRPYRTYLALYCWRVLDNNPNS